MVITVRMSSYLKIPRFLCLLSFAVAGLTLLTACSEDNEPPGQLPPVKQATEPASEAPVAAPPAPNRNPIQEWELGLCEGRLPTSLITALEEGVFAPSTTPAAIKDCKPAGVHANPEHSPFADKIRAKALLLPTPADYGASRFLRSLRLNPESLLERDAHEQGLLHHLAQVKNPQLIQILSEVDSTLVKNLSWPDDKKRLPIHYARTAEAVTKLWYLSAEEPYLDWATLRPESAHNQDITGMTPLSAMAESNSGAAVQEAVKHLCRTGMTRWPIDSVRGNEINLADIRGRTPLMMAARSNNWLAVNAIASCPSTKWNAMDKMGRTALHYAATHSDFTAGYSILTKGSLGLDDDEPTETISHIDLDAQDVNGDTALHLAYRCQNQAAIDFLLHRFGADPNRTNADGYKAADPRSVQLECPSPL